MSDNRRTKQRVLEAACDVFARKGYRDATVQEICAAADANVAAVNYYFSGKCNLYLAAWQHLSDTVQKEFFLKVAKTADPVERLRKIILQRVRHAFDDGAAGRFREVIHREIGDPTEAHEEIRKRFLRPMMDLVAGTVAEYLGVDVSDALARRCAFSIHSQLVSLARLRMKPDSTPLHKLLGGSAPTSEQIGELAEHLTTFVMGGLRAAARSRNRPHTNGIAAKE